MKKKNPQDGTVKQRKEQDDKIKARLKAIERFLNKISRGWRHA